MRLPLSRPFKTYLCMYNWYIMKFHFHWDTSGCVPNDSWALSPPFLVSENFPGVKTKAGLHQKHVSPHLCPMNWYLLLLLPVSPIQNTVRSAPTTTLDPPKNKWLSAQWCYPAQRPLVLQVLQVKVQTWVALICRAKWHVPCVQLSKCSILILILLSFLIPSLPGLSATSTWASATALDDSPFKWLVSAGWPWPPTTKFGVFFHQEV